MFTNRATWSSERIDQLKRCFQAGLSSSQIAREMGVTRNAVIGKMNRLGLSRPKDALAKQHHEQKRAAKLARPRRMRFSIRSRMRWNWATGRSPRDFNTR